MTAVCGIVTAVVDYLRIFHFEEIVVFVYYTWELLGLGSLGGT